MGHVVGDDSVFITFQTCFDDACKRIIAGFDSRVPSLYEEDRKRGNIYSKDRAGKKKYFPIMSISIAVVIDDGGRLKHYGEVSEIASQVKKKSGSNYMVDRRK